ncbi:MAG TPA: hypothetical protein VFG91_07735 [Woeseiaceae bacterium]|nr:hypothetical protein [Woeseiaceae bacterium]
MCGDFDDNQIDDELYERFLSTALGYGVKPGAGADAGPRRLADEETRSNYMGSLFHAGLARSLNDIAGLPSGERMDAVAGQAIVFARLAGLLAGQFPPEADLFRTVTSALLDGHAEADSRG